MKSRRSGWTNLQRQEGGIFLDWLEKERTLSRKFNVIAKALQSLLCREICTNEDALNVWRVVPAVLKHCDDPGTYILLRAPHAYAWLHLLDRYVRTWMALRILVKNNCIAMGQYGVQTLDVGTGPGPSAFAIHDFYSAMVEFSKQGNSQWRQPAHITCVELDASTNSLRHNLAEIMFEQSQRESEGMLAMCHALHNFGAIKPTQERRQILHSLRNAEETYYDEIRDEWASDLIYSPEEANDIAQSHHRYRLIVFSNFLTNVGTVKCFEPNLVDILQDAFPGTVLLVIGGKGPRYRKVYKRVDKIANCTGFQHVVDQEMASYSGSEVVNQVYEEEKRFYEYLQRLAPCLHQQIQEVGEHRKLRSHFEESPVPASCSEVHAYRKQRHVKGSI